MKLNQAHRKFATVSLAGWDGTNWVPDIAKGSMEVYARFITERTFGVVKRLFMMPIAVDPKYTVLRFPDGIEYMVAKESRDYRSGGVYGFTYLLQEVIAYANIVSFASSSSASGMGRSTIEVVGPLVPCYYERFGSTDSGELSAVSYSKTRIIFPHGTILNVDGEVRIGTRVFSIKEVDLELNLSRAFGVEK